MVRWERREGLCEQDDGVPLDKVTRSPLRTVLLYSNTMREGHRATRTNVWRFFESSWGGGSALWSLNTLHTENISSKGALTWTRRVVTAATSGQDTARLRSRATVI